VFCNREINMQQIRAVGFDMDYTLAQCMYVYVCMCVCIYIYVCMRVCPLVNVYSEAQ
jgi:hypothetical protein